MSGPFLILREKCGLVVPVMRMLLREAGKAREWEDAIAGLVGVAFVPALLFVPALVGSTLVQLLGDEFWKSIGKDFWVDFAFGLSSASTVLLPLIVLLIGLFSLLILLMLLDRVFWPLPNRLLYLVQRSRLLERKGWLWSIGVSMVTLAVTPYSVIRRWVDMLHSFN